MLDCKSATTPFSSRSQLSNQDATPFSDPTEFHHLLGALQYLTLTHPDIAFMVNHITQFMARPTMIHLIAAKRVLYYIKGLLDLGLVFWPHYGPLILHG